MSTDLLGDAAGVSVPLIAVVLLVREIGNVLNRRRNGNGNGPDHSNGKKAVEQAQIADIHRRTEEMTSTLAALRTAIEEMAESFRETKRAVEQLTQHLLTRK